MIRGIADEFLINEISVCALSAFPKTSQIIENIIFLLGFIMKETRMKEEEILRVAPVPLLRLTASGRDGERIRVYRLVFGSQASRD